MAGNNKQLPVLEGVEVSGVAAEGKAIARVGDRVIFIPYAAPGDVADIQLTRKKNNYAEGKAIRFHKYSPLRVEPFCRHFGTCGGCKWQHLGYEEQLKYKQQQVTDSLTRIGKLPMPEEILPILGSGQTQYYRNKLEFTFSNKKWLTEEQIRSQEHFEDMDGLGFHIPGMFDKVLDIDTCYLQADISNRIRRCVREYCLSNHYTFFDLRKQEGLMRTLIIRTSPTTGEVMLIVVFFYEDKARREALLSHLSATFPEITSLLYIINDKCNDTITDRQVNLFSGKDHIIEEMEGLRFTVGPKSFYQTNSLQAYELYKTVRSFAGLTGNESVYDLYTGAGTIAGFISARARKVTGIEYVTEAIEDARLNTRLNGITNTDFFAGDMKDILTADFILSHGRPDVIITDPPRQGMHPGVISAIMNAMPRRIVYVSCNPATQARDLSLLHPGYTLRKVQPVDMFPHTHHVENVALLTKNEED